MIRNFRLPTLGECSHHALVSGSLVVAFAGCGGQPASFNQNSTSRTVKPTSANAQAASSGDAVAASGSVGGTAPAAGGTVRSGVLSTSGTAGGGAKDAASPTGAAANAAGAAAGGGPAAPGGSAGAAGTAAGAAPGAVTASGGGTGATPPAPPGVTVPGGPGTPGGGTVVIPAGCGADGATQANLLTTSLQSTGSGSALVYQVFRTDCHGNIMALTADKIWFDIDAQMSTVMQTQYTLTVGTTTQTGALDEVVGTDMFGNTGPTFAHWETDQSVSITGAGTSVLLRIDLPTGAIVPRTGPATSLATYLRFGTAAPVTKVITLAAP